MDRTDGGATGTAIDAPSSWSSWKRRRQATYATHLHQYMRPAPLILEGREELEAVDVRLGSGGVFAVFLELLGIWTHSSPVHIFPSTGGRGRKAFCMDNLEQRQLAIRNWLWGCQVELPGDGGCLNRWGGNDFSALEWLDTLAAPNSSGSVFSKSMSPRGALYHIARPISRSRIGH